MKIAWDSELSPNDVNVFLKWFRDLYILKDVTLSRCMIINSTSELHVFVDASKEAYAACVFVRSMFKSDVKVIIVLGETPGESEEVELERKKLKVVNIDLSRDAPSWHLYAISDYSKMIRVFSWILRFVNNCTWLNGKCKDSELSQSEIENSEKKLIRLVQSYYLPDAKSSNYIETYIDDEAWWGGWWERLVRTVKELLKRTLGRSVLKYDELHTVLCDCESIINCRPLTYVSENPEELIPLTPSMFLVSNKNSNIEDIEELNSNSLNKRIKYRSKLLKDLRQRFGNEYLSQLIQKRNEKESRDPQIGEVVLVGDDNKKRLFWALAKIIELIPGRDGKIRTIRLKTQHGKILRPIQRIYPLEIRSNENLQRGLEESIPTVYETLSPDEYLKGLLTNEPASLIKHMPISNYSYEEAWQKLLDSDECLRGLNALGEQASSKDCWLIYLLLQKNDPESRRLWAIKSSEEEFPNMKAFLDFLNVRCSSLELMLNNESECKIPIRSETKGCVDVVIGSQSSNERLEVNAFILNKVTSQIPSEFLDVKDLYYLKSIPLSDEEFMGPKECDIILGSDCFFLYSSQWKNCWF
ncbi:integrase catalytic domain-containing protein [Trichonephila clavipes]|nr:integrase catalytic domain-containing protein [Trichonephila clavipes]